MFHNTVESVSEYIYTDTQTSSCVWRNELFISWNTQRIEDRLCRVLSLTETNVVTYPIIDVGIYNMTYHNVAKCNEQMWYPNRRVWWDVAGHVHIMINTYLAAWMMTNDRGRMAWTNYFMILMHRYIVSKHFYLSHIRRPTWNNYSVAWPHPHAKIFHILDH